MDAERARELLRHERERIEREIAAVGRDGPLEASARADPGDRGSENLYEDELSEGRRAELARELESLARAEARLEAGTYGLSVESGDPIPDARLEVLPTAERTVEEDERRR
jgi:DnaK suppressor protein